MAYELKFTDFANKGTIIVEDRTLDVLNTTLKFPGRGNTGFGQAVNENFLHLLENFANTSAPPRAVQGQLWYDTSLGINQLKIFDGAAWVSASNLNKSNTESAIVGAVAGDLWANTDKQQLFLYTGSAWILVGPSFSNGAVTGANSENIIGIDDQTYNVLTVRINNKIAVIVSKDDFVPKSTIPGFLQGIKAGINISDTPLEPEKPLKFRGVSERAENLLIGETVVPADKFLRNDIVSTTDFQLNVKSNSGIEVGTASQLRISLTGANNSVPTFRNNVVDANIIFQLTENISGVPVIRTVLTLDSSRKVGINRPVPESELDVIGTVQVSPFPNDATTGKIVVNNTENDSISTLGGISVSKNLSVSGESTLNGRLNSKSIIPLVPGPDETFNLGSTGRRYSNVYADTFRGNLQGNVTGDVIGRSTSTNRLASPTTFQITGDVDTDSFQFDGQQGGSTKAFTVTISENFKTTYANSLLAGDFGLIWNENNTVVDTNGFVKEASPIVRLFDTGTEEPVVSVNASFEKISTGYYVLHGVLPLATKGWQIEIPQDYNGKRLIFVDTIYDENTNTLAVYTSKREWSQEQGDWVAGEPKDIPENRWVDLRFCED